MSVCASMCKSKVVTYLGIELERRLQIVSSDGDKSNGVGTVKPVLTYTFCMIEQKPGQYESEGQL